MATEKVGYSIKEWCDATSIGRTKAYELLQGGRILSVKFDTRTIILTTPKEFLASIMEESHGKR